ncbi:MAG: hypothetical protein K0S06_1950 [Microvirga sp.]|jgi:hypothetical protein|nr:hypothetical protein [Microvirga sp.]
MAERPSTELRLELLEARLRAQEVVLQSLCKAIASIDRRCGHAVALALEVAELEQLEAIGEEDETVRLLRRFREQVEEPQFESQGWR